MSCGCQSLTCACDAHIHPQGGTDLLRAGGDLQGEHDLSSFISYDQSPTPRRTTDRVSDLSTLPNCVPISRFPPPITYLYFIHFRGFVSDGGDVRTQNRGVGLYITHLKRSPRESFEKAGIIGLLGEDAFLKDVASAMARVERAVRERAL